MKYSKELAEKIRQKYRVSDTTLRIWKMRGRIPEVYQEKLIPIKHMLKKLPVDWYSSYLQSLTDNQRKDFQRYAQENMIPKICDVNLNEETRE